MTISQIMEKMILMQEQSENWKAWTNKHRILSFLHFRNSDSARKGEECQL